VYFTVEATGSGLTYQWQYSSTGTKWTNSSNKTAKCGVTVTAAKNGYLYRCIITDENGDSITSDTATLSISSISITVQPEDWTGSIGSLSYFYVEAEGTDLTYQWQFSSNGGTTWTNSSTTGKVYRTTIRESYDGRLFRCMIYNEDGDTVYSNTAQLLASDAFAIVVQPEDQYGAFGETVYFHVQVGGTDVTYQWQQSDDGTEDWTDMDTTTATAARLQLSVGLSTIGKYYRCVITNGDDSMLTSDAVRVLCNESGFVSYGSNYSTYYIDSDGTIHTGGLTIGDNTYYFYSNGIMARGITKKDGSHIYLDFETGVQQVGMIEVGIDNYMYFSETDGAAYTGLLEVDGYLYYFSEDESTVGVALSGFQEVDGNTYYFDESTKRAVTGFVEVNDYTYYMGSDYVMVTGMQLIDGELYYFDDAGRMKSGLTTMSDGTRYYFDEETGTAIQGFVTMANGRTYYFDGANGGLTGLQTIDGSLYYLSSSSIVQTGRYTIDDAIYLFDEDTGAAVSGWTEYTSSAGNTYTMYFDPDTYTAVTGFQTIDGKTYYFSPTNGFMRTGSVNIDDVSYYFDLDTGELATGFMTRQNGHTYYYTNGQATLTGLQDIDGVLYYFSSSGYLLSGRQQSGDYYYMFDAVSGQAVTGWWTYITSSGTAYRSYFDPETCQAVTGLQTIDGETYYFSASGYMQVLSRTVDGTKYYFDQATGAAYTSGSAASNGNTWETIDGECYYYDIYGEPVTGLYTIENKLYYFDKSGVMQTGLVTADDSKTYYLTDAGALTGWQEIDGENYYFSTVDATMITGFCNISGSAYYFGEDGIQKFGWLELYAGKKSYFDETDGLVTGLYEIDGFTYYFNSSGVMMTGIISVADDTVYFFDETGALQNGMVSYKNRVYYFDPDTNEQVTGWVEIDGSEYYFSPTSGAMLTGLRVIDDRYYYLNTDTGAKETGMISYGGKIYYLSEDSDDGLLYGLTEINEKTYYFSSSGYAVTGYLFLDEVRYYFDPDTGASVSGVYWISSKVAYAFVAGGGYETGLVEDNGKTYYFSTVNGKMITGLHTVGDTLYYFDAEEGMLTNTEIEIAGVTYEIDAEGSVMAAGDSMLAALLNAGIEKLGIPYGSENPSSDYYVEEDSDTDTYSCSELVSDVFTEAGIELRTCTYLQYYALLNDGYDITLVTSVDDLQPGDIIYSCHTGCQYGDDCVFWNEIHHVAIYVGDGKVLESVTGSGSEQSGVVIHDWSETSDNFTFAIVRLNTLS
ncbi:MAG: NlpC/P60 family protein, partial [Clostridiales bacterium]|nr:NlpC/P60 family protein [Clostridiales bacterium]